MYCNRLMLCIFCPLFFFIIWSWVLCFMNKKKIGRQIFSQLKIYFSFLPKSTKEIFITLVFSAYYYNKYTSFYYDLTAPLLHTTNDDYLFSNFQKLTWTSYLLLLLFRFYKLYVHLGFKKIIRKISQIFDITKFIKKTFRLVLYLYS